MQKCDPSFDSTHFINYAKNRNTPTFNPDFLLYILSKAQKWISNSISSDSPPLAYILNLFTATLAELALLK